MIQSNTLIFTVSNQRSLHEHIPMCTKDQEHATIHYPKQHSRRQ